MPETGNHPQQRPSRGVSPGELVAFAREVLAEMANNRDVKCDRRGKPRASVRASGEAAGCTRVHLVVDMSAIGMPTDSPLVVATSAGDDWLEWSLGPTPIARTPKGATAKEAAGMLDMDTLLDAHRRLVRAESVRFPTSPPAQGKRAVSIDPKEARTVSARRPWRSRASTTARWGSSARGAARPTARGMMPPMPRPIPC